MIARAWKFEDLKKIAALEEVCFPTDAWNLQMLADSFLSDRFYGVLLEEDGEITAYGGLSFLFDEGEIPLIATAENYRRAGRGDRILTLLTEEAASRGVKTLFLEVRASNVPAQMLYQKHGFCFLSVRRKYYKDGEDALVMKKVID
ncbi:MAG: ribosomal protein S18-alanine N-acetyltransferase [Clostridia bacterium]|nr:ribosomal protein S18-alanine N-acetyltransferase [Clostridia bacterium]